MRRKHRLTINLSISRTFLFTSAALFFLTGVQAQETGVPRTRTVPGIENPAFPYAKPDDTGLSGAKLEQLGEEVHRWAINGDLIGGELLIIKDGKTIFHEAYGWADREGKRPVERNSVWSIKSMSKPFTTMAAMMLVEEGKLSLEDRLIDFIPEYRGDPRTTIGNLLSHTSGYRKYDYHDPDPSHKSLRDWVLDWAKTEPTGTFGRYDYTDFGFAACGYLVELITGISIEEFTRTRIIEPMGLQHTSTGFSDDPAWRARLNAWYRWSSETGRYDLRWTTERGPWGIYPAAWGMFSTAMDYAEFLSLFLNEGSWNGKRLLQSNTVREMLQPHGYRGKRPMYGYGWFVIPGPEDAYPPLSFGHDGGDGTMGFAWPQQNMLVVFMTHSRDGGHLNALKDRLSMLGFTDTPPAPGMIRGADLDQPLVMLNDAKATSYTGYYSGSVPEDPSDQFLIRVEPHGGHLQARLNTLGQETGMIRDLVYMGDDRFFPGVFDEGKLKWVAPDVVFHFSRHNGEVASLEVLVNGERNIFGMHVDAEKVQAELKAMRERQSVADLVNEALQAGDVEAARKLSRELHRDRPDHVGFGEGLLNTLGYRYLSKKDYIHAIAIFEMNVEAYPECPNCYDSLADAWQRKGDPEKARKYYRKAVELGRKQNDPYLDAMEAKLERVKGMIEKKGPDTQ